MIDKLSFLKVGADAGAMSAEDERLMQLFQNRAGLKKAYADLKDEFHLLRDRLKQQEGATIRIQEQHDALGELLADPGTGFSALVFFQLRGLWKTCHQQLSKFAADLTSTQQQRETAKHTAECAAAKSVRLEDVDQRLQSAVQNAALERQKVTNAEHALTRLTAFWHYFERRRRHKALGPLRHAVSLAEGEVTHLQAEHNTISDEPFESFPGISLTARRNINLAIISYAELLCENVDTYGLAAKAKEAVARRVHDMTFGTRAECEDFMARVQKAQQMIAAQKQLMATLKIKMERLRTNCEFRNSADTVPTADSLVAAGPSPWNVLAEDYWDLYTLLLR